MEYLAVAAFVAVFVGSPYAAAIYRINSSWPDEVRGLIWVEVVFGVLLTVGAGWVADKVVGIPASWPWIVALFTATGGPMIVGCLVRHCVSRYRRRKRGQLLLEKKLRGASNQSGATG